MSGGIAPLFGGGGVAIVGLGGPPSRNLTITLGSSVGSHSANPFFAVVLSDAGLGIKGLQGLGAFFNHTPIGWYRFGGGGADYNPTTQKNYVPPPGGSGNFVAVSGTLWNLTWFKSWCLSRATPCDWLSYLPAEENLTSAAVHFAKWYHSVLGLAPTTWEFGNEPKAWTHFGKNQTTWNTADALTPNGTAYGTMVRNYIAAVSALYPNDRFVGIEAGCACNWQLISSTAAMDGSQLAGMAYHSYPIDPTSSTSLTGFYGTLSYGTNLSGTSGRFRTNMGLFCGTCGNIPVDVGEYQAGPHGNFSPYASTYAGAPYLAASVIQALYANISTFTIYDSNMLMNTSTGAPTYEGLLYSRVLENMTMGTDVGVTLNSNGVGGVYGILIKNGTKQSLLLVNTNTTYAVKLALTTSIFNVGHTGSEWLWSNGVKLPSASLKFLLPTSYSIGPQGILLLNNY